LLEKLETGPDVWEELRSLASLEVISTCVKRIGMVTRMRMFLALITQLSEEKDTLGVVECLFV